MKRAVVHSVMCSARYGVWCPVKRAVVQSVMCSGGYGVWCPVERAVVQGCDARRVSS